MLALNALEVAGRRLAQGDFAIGDRILVERKTARDFVDTLINRDLLGQVISELESRDIFETG